MRVDQQGQCTIELNQDGLKERHSNTGLDAIALPYPRRLDGKNSVLLATT